MPTLDNIFLQFNLKPTSRRRIICRKIMDKRRIRRYMHSASTAWFVLCIGYVFVLILRQAGFSWLAIFSFAGHSVLLVFLLISLYLFAIYRGVSRSQKIQREHPLTTSIYYKTLYNSAPFLGGLGGILGLAGVSTVSEMVLGVCLSTLGATFLVWIIVDPACGLVELALPGARAHRRARLTQIKAEKLRQEIDREKLLKSIELAEAAEEKSRREKLEPHSERLAELVSGKEADAEKAESEIISIGMEAWREGGLNGMKQLLCMAEEHCSLEVKNKASEYISALWDGVGNWRNEDVLASY